MKRSGIFFLKEFKGVKHTKQYKSEVEKLLANATKEKNEEDEWTGAIALLLKSEVAKQVKFATDTKPEASAAAAEDSSDNKFHSAIRAILKTKDKVGKWGIATIPNFHTQEYIVSVICGSVWRDVNHSWGSAYLDSRTNMIVCGSNVYIISKPGQVTEVNAFAKECVVLHIPSVDATVVFEDPYEGNIYLLVM